MGWDGARVATVCIYRREAGVICVGKVLQYEQSYGALTFTYLEHSHQKSSKVMESYQNQRIFNSKPALKPQEASHQAE